jgi:MinD-like ATPase involved in chromosome partitioning or flagellar assembly
VPFVISHPRSPIARAVQKMAQSLTEGESGSVAERLVNVARVLGPLAKLSGKGGKS